MSECVLEHKTPQRPGKTQNPAKPPFYITSVDAKCGSNMQDYSPLSSSKINISAKTQTVSIHDVLF